MLLIPAWFVLYKYATICIDTIADQYDFLLCIKYYWTHTFIKKALACPDWQAWEEMLFNNDERLCVLQDFGLPACQYYLEISFNKVTTYVYVHNSRLAFMKLVASLKHLRWTKKGRCTQLLLLSRYVHDKLRRTLAIYHTRSISLVALHMTYKIFAHPVDVTTQTGHLFL